MTSPRLAVAALSPGYVGDIHVRKEWTLWITREGIEHAYDGLINLTMSHSVFGPLESRAGATLMWQIAQPGAARGVGLHARASYFGPLARNVTLSSQLPAR
jgi:hypothetical protein